MKWLVGLFLLVAALSGCAIKWTIYGKSGTPYVAPDLCAALIACQKAGEAQCLYPVTSAQVDGGKIVTETTQCKDLIIPPK